MNYTNRNFIVAVILAAQFFLLNTYAQTVRRQPGMVYPAYIEAALQKAGKNRLELEKAIHHFAQSGDSLKLKAIYFLIENMDIHVSSNYYWADSLNKKIPFNELNYSTYDESLKAFEEIKKSTHGLHPVPIKYKDIDSIKGDFLIENLEKAFEAWESPYAKHLPFNLFCEYVLPYRISAEPLQNWRADYKRKFATVLERDSIKTVNSANIAIKKDIRNWFVNTYYIENRKEPLPRLGPEQLLFRKQGPCEDIAGLAVYALRSQGLICTEDIAIYWGTSSGSHFWNVVCDQRLKPIPIDVTNRDTSAYKLAREPAKVIRLTYSKQKDALASQIPENDIPDNPLRLRNTIDVTDQYWPVKDISCSLYPTNTNAKVAYACVFNYSQWKPSWWGLIDNRKVTFKKMSQGVIYLPMYFTGNKLLPAGNPVAIPNQGDAFEIVPDTARLQTISIKEQDKYLIYRPGKKYKLFYWDKQWKVVDTKVAGTDHELVFDKVPYHALLLLVPEYSQSKERPFIYNDKGERLWW